MHHLSYNWEIIPASQAPPLLPNSVFRTERGLFESMLAVNFDVPLLTMHFSRLMSGMKLTGIDIPAYLTEAFLRDEVTKLLSYAGQQTKGKKQQEYSKVRLQVFVDKNGSPAFILESMPIAEADALYNERGLTVGIVADELKEIDGTEHLKRISPGMYRSVSNIVAANGWDDVLMVHKGFIMESGTSNIFWVKDNRSYTPPLSAGCIEGVMRTFIISCLNAADREVTEMPLTPDILLAADEVFLTNAVRRIKWVAHINHAHYSNHFSKALYGHLFGA